MKHVISLRASGAWVLACGCALATLGHGPAAIAAETSNAASKKAATSKKSADETTGVQTRNWSGETLTVKGKRLSYTAPTSFAATRTDTPLIQVPQSVEVITRTLIQEQDSHALSAALVNVSGITPTRSDAILFVPPIVRGFPAEIYLDGLPIFAGNQQAFAPNALVGVERIEVLKGPSATLYGGGLGTPLGGIIDIESERPDDRTGGYVAMRGGSYATLNPYGDVNLTLSPRVSVRLAGEYQSYESWIDKVHGRQWSIQPSLLYEIDDETDLVVRGQFNDRRNLEYSGLPADEALAGKLDRHAFPGSPINQPETHNENRMGSVALHHAFSDRAKLTVTGRYYDNTVHEYGSFVDPDLFPTDASAPTVYNVLPILMHDRTREATFDANLAARLHLLGGTHQLLGGIDYDRTGFYSAMGFGVSDTPSGTIDLANPLYALRYTPQLPVNSYTNDHYETYAVYAQDQATYGRLHVTGGLRFTALKFHEVSDYGVANKATYSHISPRIGATFDIVPGVALYAGYATAFRAPFGFVGLAAPRPETSRNVEVGVKTALPGTGLSGTIGLFRQTHDNVAVSDMNNVGYYVQSGRQRAQGVEADIVWEPAPAFSLLANYACTDTRDDGVSPGDRIARVPKSSGRVAARYRLLHGWAEGLSFGAGVTAYTSRQLTLPNTIAVPGYAVIDAQAAYTVDRYTLGVSIVNLGNRKAWDPYSYLGNPVVAPIQPLSAYVTLKVRL
ncbi:TonB-dependent siderophore receptor [Gluconacetobacter sacchari DSM 12717]|uniref:TonB-dependent receptor n=2 Tax=Gluconacetobacter sacchari TaxID=92759 RepID=A0A7W4I9I7_9PROT|nr:TonB-dependent receptor [Gluconacetobacter sacchari]MBB2158769.1 TonB-dependent receptor [Gluconacetobacter sacchari]GBQ21965.1 TonB-dependent siderophore receptor [Gluconacetobacter sacchari DSM 12717]